MQFNEHEEKNQLDSTHLPEANDYITWCDVRGLADTSLLSQIGLCFNMHPLALEDIVDPIQRPKVNGFDDGILMIVKSINLHSVDSTVVTKQVSIYYLNTQYI